MRVRLLSWWQKVKQHPWITVAVVVGIVFIVVLILGYWLNWDWTGLGPYTPPTQTSNVQRGKTLWDWLQLLFIPIMLAFGGFWLNQLQKSREEKATEERTKIEQEATEKRAEVEREIAEDNQRETALQDYIMKISELLLHENLRDKDDVRIIARAQVVTVLPRLDGRRKGSMLLFLSEARLIEQPNPTIAFGAAGVHGADLSGVDLNGIHKPDLSNISVTYAILNKANFSEVYLKGAVFEGSHLCEATLINADLREVVFFFANLRNADLTRANLTDAILIRANLEFAKLTGANLTDAIVTTEQLKDAKSLKGATMPDGSKHP
jgi:uncharacterized protein YjbI with pentapeptide repeats